MSFVIARFLLPIISGILYRMGGSDKYPGWCRSLIGVPIGITYAIGLHSYIPLLCILTYWFQPPYGEKSYLNCLGEYGKFCACGMVFSLSSFPALGFTAIIQGLIGGVSFLAIKILDEKNIIKNPIVEIARGGFGTILT